MGPIPPCLRILPLAMALTLGAAALAYGQTAPIDARATIELTVEGVFPEAVERLEIGSRWADRLADRSTPRARELADRLADHTARRAQVLHEPGRTFGEIRTDLESLDRRWESLARETRAVLEGPHAFSSGPASHAAGSGTR